jgi:mono/diheme cytochrome c family protein
MTMPRSQPTARTLLAALLLCSAAGCDATPEGGGDAADAYTPGLHAMMLELQLRHATLWFAGEAANWELADYQIHELEGLLEEIARYHPTYRDHPIGELLQAMLEPAIEEMEDAVDAADAAAFTAGFDRLTAGCNACHAATERGMIVIQRPRTPPLDNLRFAPGSPER